MKRIITTLCMAIAVCTCYAKTIKLVPGSGGSSIYISDPGTIGYAPGDTLLIEQNVSSLYLTGINGTIQDTVVIMTTPGVVVGGADNRTIEISSSSFFKLYNFDVIGHSDIMGCKIGGSTNFTVENVSVNTAAVGFAIKTDPASENFAYPNFIMRDIAILNCSAENINNEGFYIGQTSDLYHGYKTPPIIGLKIRNCSVTNTGWDGFQITSAQNCDVSGIKVYNVGQASESGQRSGITIQDATTGSFSNLYVDGVTGAGLNIFSSGAVYYSNIVLKNVAKQGNGSAIYVDNRTDRGFGLGAQQLFMTNVVIQGGAPSPGQALYDQNGSSNGAVKAIPGVITNLTYDPSLWPKSVDNVPNQYVGGTEGTSDTSRPNPPNPNDTTSIPGPTPSPSVGGFLSISADKVTIYYPDGRKDVYDKSKSDTIAMTKPAPPNNLQAAVAGKSVTLTWSAPAVTGGSLISSYLVYRQTAARAATRPVAVNSGLSYVDTGVMVGETYLYKVTAVNSVGESEPTPEVSASVVAVPLPPSPQNLAATGGVGTVSLNWAAPASGTDAFSGYVLHRGTVKGFTTDLVTTVDKSVTSYSDANLVAGTYYYTVTTTTGSLQSLKSNEVSALVTPPPTTPSAPQSLSSVAGILQATLTWSAPLSNGNAPINNYKVYRGTSSGTGSVVATLNGDVFTYTDGNLTNGTKYYYTVTAVNSAAESPKSNEVTYTASSYTLPSGPTNFKAVASSGAVTLTWAVPANTGGTTITNYKLWRGTISGKYNPISTLNGNTFTITDTNKVNGTTYYYNISAINSVGEGPMAGEISATPH